MYLGLCLIGVAAAVWTITACAARPASPPTGSRDLERRRAHLRACPARVTQVDVECLLRSQALSESMTIRVLGTAAERRIGWATLWSWADRFGADKLVLALDADVAERRLRRHLEGGTTPDWAAMSLFAGLNRDTLPYAEVVDADAAVEDDLPGFELEEWESPDLATAPATDVDLSQFGHLPPIYDPGLPLTLSAFPPTDQGWPKVA
ncbi:hypothetical protein [Nocardioides sp. URHA0020]|uniref:hypothetical protein n=1 Tax=Nocardioides sp. URHA0020 TaxID=1380392 RepID=UPI00048E8D9B|nr:hypothetical protein [Nocardioides sp. URHA0020]